MKTNKKIKLLRWFLLAVFLLLITIQGYLHQVKGGGEAASIHALCPYGALESLYSLIGSGTFIQKIFSGTVILFVITIIIALLFRRSFCGLICPFGALQEFFALLGKKIFKKNFKVNKKLDTNLRYLKYVVLLITIYYAWRTAGLWMSPYDPWTAYAHLSEGISSLIEESLIGFILLIVTIIGSIFYDRFFCKYLCPMGAVYGLVSKLSPHRIIRNEEKCINCQLCVLSYPKEGCLETKQINKTFKPSLVISLVIVLFFSGIAISKSLGIYNTLPAPIPANATISVDEIKGYMTLKEVADGLEIDIMDLYKKLGISEDVPEETKFKEVKIFIPDFTDEKAKDILKRNQ